MQKKLIMSVYDNENNKIERFCKDSASIDDVVAVLRFLRSTDEMRLRIVDCDEKGNPV